MPKPSPRTLSAKSIGLASAKLSASPSDTSGLRQISFGLAALVLLGAVVWLVYGRAINTPFIYDDWASVTKNTSIVRLWPLWGDEQHPRVLNPPKHLPTSGRPLVNLSLALNYHFGRLDPAGYHTFNIVVHILSAMLLMLIVRRTLCLDYFGGRFQRVSGPLAFAAALLWALHPLQTETVIYTTQRTELLVGFFYLSTLYGSLRYWSAVSPAGRRTWLTLSTLCCLAGMASKEVMVTAPVIVLLFDRTFISGSFRGALRQSWSLYVGLALGWVLIAALNFGAPRSDSAGFHLGVSAYDWWLTQAKVFWMYVKLVVWPWPLAIHYDIPYLSSFDAAWLWAVPLVLLILATLVLNWRRSAIGFVAAWVLIVLSPTLIVPIITEVAAERRMYLPLAALATLVVVGTYALAQQVSQPLNPAFNGRSVPRWAGAMIVVVGVLVAGVFSLVSVHRLAAYQDELTLWQDNVARYPDDPIAHNYLGFFSKPQDAIQHFEKALRIKPDYCLAYYNLGLVLAQTGKPEEGLECFRKAAQLEPYFPMTFYRIGNVQKQLGHVDESIKAYQKALRLDATYEEARVALADTLLDAGRTQEATRQYQQALRFDPDSAELLYDFARALKRAGQLHEAIEQYERALALRPEFPEAQNNLGVALKQSGRLPEAIDHYQQALQIKPDYTEAMVNMATAYAQLNHSEEAIAAAQKALELAKSQGQTELVGQIESWLQSYAVRSADQPDKSQVPTFPAKP